MSSSRFTVSLGFGVSLLFAAAFVVAASADDQTPVTFKQRISHQEELHYLLHLPRGYDRSAKGQRWPLVLFLHGAGERGSDVEQIKKHGPPKLIAAGKDIPAVVVSPQCPTNQWWTDHLEGLAALLDSVQHRYRVDPDRVYVTGMSMGGFGTWAMISRYPERFAAAVPICGGGILAGLERVLNLPIWAFHGEADDRVSVDESRRLIEALQQHGATQAKLTTYPGVKHDSWTRTYDDPAMWEWLFAQKRPAPGAAARLSETKATTSR
jgi:predicted peptidase